MPEFTFPDPGTPYVVSPWTDPNGQRWLYIAAKDLWDPVPDDLSFEDLSDAATVDLPEINGPLSEALDGKANLQDGNAFEGAQTISYTANSGNALFIQTTDAAYFGSIFTIKNSLGGVLFAVSQDGNISAGASITVATGGVSAPNGNITGLNLSGTNRGDQTSIVGITGTMAEYNTSCTNGTFAFAESGNTFLGNQTFNSTVEFKDTLTFTSVNFSFDAGSATNLKLILFPSPGAIGNITPATSLAVGGTTTLGGQVNVTANIASTNTTTGSVVVTGGVGISENLNVEGNITGTGNITTGAPGSAASPILRIGGDTDTGWWRQSTGAWAWSSSGSSRLALYSFGVRMRSAHFLCWSNGDPTTISEDCILTRDTAATLQMGSDHVTSPTNQTFKAHDVITGTGAKMTIAGGRGSVSGGSIGLATSATNGAPVDRLTVAADGSVSVTEAFFAAKGVSTGPPVTVASLPTPTSSMRHMVTDSTVTHTAGIGAVVVGGGANTVPVVYNGTNWRIG